MSRLLPLAILYFCLSSGLVGAAEAESQVRPVSVTPVADLVFHPLREAPATVVSLNHSLVSAEVAARVAEVSRRPGDSVQEGEVLARLDCRIYRIAEKRAAAALQAARARYKYARQRYQDAQKLVKSRNISSDEFNQRSSESNRLAAELNIREADLDQARWRVARCTIEAPFDAVVTERKASVGDYATTGTPIMGLVDLQHLEVSAQVQQQQVADLPKAEALQFELEGRRYPLRLRAVVPLLDRRSRSQEVRLVFTADRAPPGAAGRLLWRSPEPHLPAHLLVQRDGRLGVFLYQEGVARFVPLPDSRQGMPAKATGLPADALLIVDGRFALTDGQPVEPVEP